MTRALVAAGLLVWAGATLLLSLSARVSRPSLADRLKPFHPGTVAPGPPGTTSVASVQEVFGPLARDAGDRLAALFGAAEPAARRLERIHSDRSAVSYRMAQAGWSALALVTGAVLAAAAGAPVPVAILMVAGAPLLTFLVIEQRLARASEEWQRRSAEELPVIAEQLAMLLNSGLSLGAALNRLATRGRGCVARDLDRVVNRIAQGLSEREALEEWADLSGGEAVRRLVGVLTLHSEAADLGRLVSAEARQARRDLHRRTVETLERRAQQVWVPVTVATLVPGVILLAVPFLAALSLFSNA